MYAKSLFNQLLLF